MRVSLRASFCTLTPTLRSIADQKLKGTGVMNTTSKALCLLLLPAALLVQAGPSVASTVDIDLLNFGITPNQPGATTNYTATAGPVACNGGTGTCTTTLLPASVTSLAAGGSASFLAQLGAQ